MSAASALDLRFMGKALGLAEAVLGLTSPNPAVGCVVVRGGRIVGRGATAPGGRPHAETQALKRAGARARGATVYVTFEPCAHRGATPSCARALAEARVKRVVVGCVDPYPPVRGRGVAILRRCGIEVTTGALEDKCRRMNEGFITRVTRRRPFGILKLAMTLDGRIAAAGGDSRWISSAESRALVHRWRRECDAVVVGAGTVLNDDPRLTCRTAGGRDPVRVIVDAQLDSPPSARVFTQRSKAAAVIVTSGAKLALARRRYQGNRVEVMSVPARAGHLDLSAMMREFGRRGWRKVMFEGGARLAASALEAGIIDRVAFFITPKILGSGLPAVEGLARRRIRDAVALAGLSVTRIGGDILAEARPIRRSGFAR